MEDWYRELSSTGGQLAGRTSFSVTGYSLGGHLATAFNQLHIADKTFSGALRVKEVVTFNGAGIGGIDPNTNLARIISGSTPEQEQFRTRIHVRRFSPCRALCEDAAKHRIGRKHLGDGPLDAGLVLHACGWNDRCRYAYQTASTDDSYAIDRIDIIRSEVAGCRRSAAARTLITRNRSTSPMTASARRILTTKWQY